MKKQWRKKFPSKKFLTDIRMIALLFMVETGRWQDLKELTGYPWIDSIFKKLIRHKLIKPVNSRYVLDGKAREKLKIFEPIQRRRIILMFNSFLLWEEKKKGAKRWKKEKHRTGL